MADPVDPLVLGEFINWARSTTGLKLRNLLLIERTTKSAAAIIAERGTPLGTQQFRTPQSRDRVLIGAWWSNAAMRDFGDFRLVYQGP
jgi:hypothetical protein